MRVRSARARSSVEETSRVAPNAGGSSFRLLAIRPTMALSHPVWCHRVDCRVLDSVVSIHAATSLIWDLSRAGLDAHSLSV